jgi:hypothetical protein
MAEEIQGASKQSFKNLLDLIAAIAGVAGFFYTLGILLLSMQIHLTYDLPFASTWQAATLVPEPIVFGQGIRVILADPLLIIFCALFFAFRKPQSVDRRAEERDNSDLSKKIIWIGNSGWDKWDIKIVLGTTVAIVLMYLITGLILIKQNSVAPAFEFAKRATSVILTFVFGGFISMAAIETRKQNYPFFARVGVIFVVAYVGVFLAAMLRGDLNEPPLTKVEIKQGKTLVQGRLLAHKDDYWHIIEDSGNIIAISNDEAKVVTIRKGK